MNWKVFLLEISLEILKRRVVQVPKNRKNQQRESQDQRDHQDPREHQENKDHLDEKEERVNQDHQEIPDEQDQGAKKVHEVQ
jgi:hypothetical protein